MNKNLSHQSAIEEQLLFYLKEKQTKGMTDYLESLSNADFRTAGNILGEKIMAKLDEEDFWILFKELALYNPKAFLGTCLKAVKQKYMRGHFSLKSKAFASYSETVVKNDMKIDQQKAVKFLLPILKEPDDMRYLLDLFHIEDPSERIKYLIRNATLPSYYLLFESAKQLEHEKDTLCRFCMELIREGHRYSYNLVSLFKSYFDLPQINGTFSLNIKPYQLNYIDLSYEKFCKIMNSI